MELEQALFTSTRSQRVSGYHLVARSPGIDETAAQALCRWSPSHDSMLRGHASASSLNFFAIDNDRFGISRTVHGGPEYSGRGGLQTVTMILVARRKQLAAYFNDPVALSRVARSNGYLSYIRNANFQIRVTMPDQCFPYRTKLPSKADSNFASAAISQIKQGKDIALSDAVDAAQAYQWLIHQLPFDQRLEMSFTTGLKPSEQRPFRAHHVKRPGIDLRAYFSRKKVTMISVNQPQAVA